MADRTTQYRLSLTGVLPRHTLPQGKTAGRRQPNYPPPLNPNAGRPSPDYDAVAEANFRHHHQEQ